MKAKKPPTKVFNHIIRCGGSRDIQPDNVIRPTQDTPLVKNSLDFHCVINKPPLHISQLSCFLDNSMCQ